MDSITIAGRAFPAARPSDLGDRLAAATGLSIAEARRILIDTTVPALLARAIDPLLTGDDRPSLADIGEMIDPDRIADVSRQVAAFYADPPAVAPDPAAPPVVEVTGNGGE